MEITVTAIIPEGSGWTAHATVNGERYITYWDTQPTEAQIEAHLTAQIATEEARRQAAALRRVRESYAAAMVGEEVDDWVVSGAEVGSFILSLIPQQLQIHIDDDDRDDLAAAIRRRLVPIKDLVACINNSDQRSLAALWLRFGRAVLVGNREDAKAAVLDLLALGAMTAADAQRMKDLYDALEEA